MKFIDAGTCGLPVEIWRLIFNLLATPCPHILPQTFGPQYSQLDLWPRLNQHPKWFASVEVMRSLIIQRRKIIQVCKLWYFIGLPLLWREFILDLDRPHRSLLALSKRLSNTPQLATNVMHLIIFPMSLVLQSRSKKNLKIIPTILSYLPNVTAISTATLSASSSMKPEVVFKREREYQSSFQASLILSGSGFWDNCHSLFFDGTMPLLRPSPPAGIKISLPRLTYLRIEVLYEDDAKWIVSSWKIPSLRALTLNGGMAVDCLELLQRFSTTLEVIKVPRRWNVWSVSTPPQVAMNRLHSLGISREGVSYSIPEGEKWFNHIIAPNLRQITFYIQYWPSYLRLSSHFRTQVEAAQAQYPILQHIVIQCPYQKSIFSTQNKGGFVSIEHLDYLSSKGLVVDIFVEGKGRFEWYTSEGRRTIEEWKKGLLG